MAQPEKFIALADPVVAVGDNVTAVNAGFALTLSVPLDVKFLNIERLSVPARAHSFN